MWAARSPRSPSSAALIWPGVSSRVFAAASSMARGRPSRKRQRSATSSAWSRSRKSGATASARSTNISTAGAAAIPPKTRPPAGPPAAGQGSRAQLANERQPARGQHGQARGPIHQVVHQSATVGDRLQVVQHDQDARVQGPQRGLVIAPGHREGQLASQLGLVRALRGAQVDDAIELRWQRSPPPRQPLWTFRSLPAPSASASGPVRRTAHRGSVRRGRDARTWGWRAEGAAQGHVALRPGLRGRSGDPHLVVGRQGTGPAAGTTARPGRGPAAGSPPRAVAAPGPGRCRARRRAAPAPVRRWPTPPPARSHRYRAVMS